QLAGAAERLAGARKRMGILFNANPRLIDAIPGPAEVLGLALSPDGRHLAAGTSDQDVRVYDVAKGSETFRVAGRDNVVRGGISNVQHLQFTADSSAIVVTGVTGNVAVPEPPAASMQRIDVGKRDWIAPPAQFANFLDASYSFDGRYAVLTNQSEQAQFWATDPWRPLSPLRTPPAQVGASSRLVAPDGNLFAQDTQAHAVVLINARSLTVRARVNLGDFGTIAAWAFSPDSRWLALGDLAGAVAVVDCRTLAVQRPAPQPYFPIFSLAFSADGGWLAAAATAGGVFLWSWPDAQLVAPPFSGSGSLAGIPDALHAVPDRARGLVLSSSETDSTVLWQLAPAASTLDRADAVPLTARLNATHAVQSEQIAWDAARGLLALRSDQRIMLQRLPPPALKHGRAARLIPDTLRFDGRHLVEVDGRSIRIVDTAFEQPAGARVELARPADFAELSADGATLAVICGRMLYAFDAVSGVARFAPTALGGSPSHAVLSPDGKRILIAWSHHGGEGPIVRSDMAVVHDLATGARLGGPAALTGQAHEITFSDDGRRVIAWTRLMLTLRDGSTLAQVPGPLGLFLPNGTKNDLSKERLKVARFDAAGNVVMAYARPGSGEGSASWSLRTWTADGSVREQPLSSVLPLAILPLPDHRTVVAGTEGGMSIVAADGSGQDLPDLPDDSMRMHFAASADGHWLGRARRDGVALFDLRGGTLMATLRVALPRPDTVWQLAFAPDGNKLLGRSLHGRLMVWDLTPDARAPDAIARDLELRDFKPLRSGSRIFSADPSAAERAALRASDPGAPPAPAVPAALETVRMLPGGGIPPRDASAPDTTLDLTPWYTFGLREVLPTVENGGADFHWLPQGVQRLLDVDYDIRGGIGLHSPLRARFDLRRDIGAVDVLLLSEANINATGKDHVADLRLDYADGTQATLPAGLLHDSYYIFGEAGAPASARFAGWGTDARVGTDRHIMLFVARVENPHPEKTVDALTLSAPGNASVQSAIMAVSVEAAPAGKPSASRE
ncbi:MAG: WD40 repeat domain-containing protein, partial [Proteobacteria bacterium]|nr:WD40 repeat domain-containing protein [Pseudomonadota bacterium]